ncbi:hypothetical protein BDV96DRAFT_297680 [Lophiotrema nucula]|uniref:Uncharacterized protein n=1 Tax=Lophiotrema nucula TaxID=690887 RepID=A0A6A5YMR2_9PLEO|nr:hypothetical protein BDV96DRAFT_297680 [Lophiotrema nucula]
MVTAAREGRPWHEPAVSSLLSVSTHRSTPRCRIAMEAGTRDGSDFVPRRGVQCGQHVEPEDAPNASSPAFATGCAGLPVAARSATRVTAWRTTSLCRPIPQRVAGSAQQGHYKASRTMKRAFNCFQRRCCMQ